MLIELESSQIDDWPGCRKKVGKKRGEKSERGERARKVMSGVFVLGAH